MVNLSNEMELELSDKELSFFGFLESSEVISFGSKEEVGEGC